MGLDRHWWGDWRDWGDVGASVASGTEGMTAPMKKPAWIKRDVPETMEQFARCYSVEHGLALTPILKGTKRPAPLEWQKRASRSMAERLNFMAQYAKENGPAARKALAARVEHAWGRRHG